MIKWREIEDPIGYVDKLLLGFGASYPDDKRNYSTYDRLVNKWSNLGAVLIKNNETNSYTLSLEVPRFTREQITIEFEGNTIKVSGYRGEKAKGGIDHFDYSNTEFDFRYTFPEKVSIGEATLENGILTITAMITSPNSLRIPIK